MTNLEKEKARKSPYVLFDTRFWLRCTLALFGLHVCLISIVLTSLFFVHGLFLVREIVPIKHTIDDLVQCDSAVTVLRMEQ